MASGAVLVKFRVGLALVVMLLCGMFVSISPAYADLRVCNQTSEACSP